MARDHIGSRMKALRQARGLSQDEMARLLGFNDRQTVSTIETGTRRVTAQELLLAMEKLGVPLEYFTDPFRLDGEGRFSRRQTVRQQAERGVALGTVPAGDARTGRGLACVGAVPRQRAVAARMMRTAHQGCITPALGRNVLLAGKPRPKTKLHPAVARRSHRPRGPTSPFSKTGSAYRAGESP